MNNENFLYDHLKVYVDDTFYNSHIFAEELTEIIKRAIYNLKNNELEGLRWNIHTINDFIDVGELIGLIEQAPFVSLPVVKEWAEAEEDIVIIGA